MHFQIIHTKFEYNLKPNITIVLMHSSLEEEPFTSVISWVSYISTLFIFANGPLEIGIRTSWCWRIPHFKNRCSRIFLYLFASVVKISTMFLQKNQVNRPSVEASLGSEYASLWFQKHRVLKIYECRMHEEDFFNAIFTAGTVLNKSPYFHTIAQSLII